MLSVVVLVVDDEFSVSAKEPRGDAPVAADPHSPGALPFALERMKSKTGEPPIFRIHRGVQATQDQAQSIGMCGLEFGPGSRLEEADQTLVLKAPDHGSRCNRYRYGLQDALRFSSPACASPSGGLTKVRWREFSEVSPRVHGTRLRCCARPDR